MDRERHAGTRAVDRASRGIDHMLNTVMAAAFQNIECTDHVTVDVAVRILQRIAHTCLCTKMHHSLEFLACKQFRDPCLISKVHAHKTESRLPLQALEPRDFKSHVVIVIQVIEPDHLIATTEKT